VPAHVQKRLRDEANGRQESLKTKTLTISNLTKTIHDCMPHTPHTPTYVCCSVLQFITVCCSEMQCVVIASHTHHLHLHMCCSVHCMSLSHTNTYTHKRSLSLSLAARAQYFLLSDTLPCPPSASKRHGHDDNGSTRGTQGGRCAA